MALRMKSRSSFTSRFLLLFLLFAFCISTILIFYNRYSTNVVCDQVLTVNQSIQQKCIEQLDIYLAENSSLLYLFAVNNAKELRQFAMQANSSYLRIQLWNTLLQSLNEQDVSDALFLYAENVEDLLFAAHSRAPFNSSQRMQECVRGLLADPSVAYSCTDWSMVFLRTENTLCASCR